MKQYRFFKWDGHNNLAFLGEEITEQTLIPGLKVFFPDTDDKEKEWLISEVHCPNPKFYVRPDGSECHPDPIVILRKEVIP